jgi:hypothetical protein
VITQARLKELLRYNKKTGVFTWRVTNSPRALKGAVAGCVKRGDCDYHVIRLDTRLYRANRLAWLYVTGAWPITQVDHENRNSLDDAWKNLRLVTNKQNGENASLRRDNKSGHRGVRKRADTGQWLAVIKHNYRNIHLGCFDTKAAAVAARQAAERELFTHSEVACR